MGDGRRKIESHTLQELRASGLGSRVLGHPLLDSDMKLHDLEARMEQKTQAEPRMERSGISGGSRSTDSSGMTGACGSRAEKGTGSLGEPIETTVLAAYLSRLHLTGIQSRVSYLDQPGG